MRIVREQMLCVVSGGWPKGSEAVFGKKGIRERLGKLLRGVGVIHYASWFVIPVVGAGAGADVDLVLELAVDEGVRPQDLIERMVWDADGAIWDIYEPLCPGELGCQGRGARNEWLARKLLDDAGIADGAFVGTRDRCVRQIREERALFDATRERAAELHPLGADRRTLARVLAGWVIGETPVQSITGPAPRSFWRARGRSRAVRLGAIAGVAIAAVYAALWALSLVPLWPAVTSYPLHFYERLLCLLAVGAATGGLLLGLLPAVLAPWRRWLGALERELNRPTETWSSRLTYVGALVVVTLLVAAALDYLLVGGAWLAGSLRALGVRPVEFLLGLLGLMVAVVLLVCLIFRKPAKDGDSAAGSHQQLRKLRQWLRRPIEDEVPRAQQVHESVERCEAELAGGTAHMISLTDLRWPYRWSAFWTRLVLRIVTLFGYLLFTEGRLGSAPGIHFGHWQIVQKGRRLLFCSNFDGSFGGYLDDFINGAARGTTLFWRWTTLQPRPPAAPGHPDVQRAREFPPTRLLMFKGVKCELTFKAYARDSMLPHLFRFDASDLSIDQIDRATGLRDALYGERNVANDDRIMKALEA